MSGFTLTALQALAHVHQAVKLIFVSTQSGNASVLYLLEFLWIYIYTSLVPVSTEAPILSQNVNWLSAHKHKHMKMAATASNTWPKRRNAIPICVCPSNQREGKKMKRVTREQHNMDIKACPSAAPILSFLAELCVTVVPASQMGKTEIAQIWKSSDMMILWHPQDTWGYLVSTHTHFQELLQLFYCIMHFCLYRMICILFYLQKHVFLKPSIHLLSSKSCRLRNQIHNLQANKSDFILIHIVKVFVEFLHSGTRLDRENSREGKYVRLQKEEFHKLHRFFFSFKVLDNQPSMTFAYCCCFHYVLFVGGPLFLQQGYSAENSRGSSLDENGGQATNLCSSSLS